MASRLKLVILDTERPDVLSPAQAFSLANAMAQHLGAEVRTSRVRSCMELAAKLSCRVTADDGLNPSPVLGHELVQAPDNFFHAATHTPYSGESNEDLVQRVVLSMFSDFTSNRIVLLPTSCVSATSFWLRMESVPVAIVVEAVWSIGMTESQQSVQMALYTAKQVESFLRVISGLIEQKNEVNFQSSRTTALEEEAKKAVVELQAVSLPEVSVEHFDYAPALGALSAKLQDVRTQFTYAMAQLEQKIEEVKAVKSLNGKSLQQSLSEVKTVQEQQRKLADLLKSVSEQALPSLAQLSTRLEKCEKQQAELHQDLQHARGKAGQKQLVSLTFSFNENGQLCVALTKTKSYDINVVVRVRNTGGAISEQRIQMTSPDAMVIMGKFEGDIIVCAEDEDSTQISKTYKLTASLINETKLVFTAAASIETTLATLRQNFGEDRAQLLIKLGRGWKNESVDRVTYLFEAVMDQRLSTEQEVIEHLRAENYEFDLE